MDSQNPVINDWEMFVMKKYFDLHRVAYWTAVFGGTACRQPIYKGELP